MLNIITICQHIYEQILTNSLESAIITIIHFVIGSIISFDTNYIQMYNMIMTK